MGGGGSAPPAPKVITPEQAAQAATETAGAGELMSIANQPIETYANLATNMALGPASIQAQTALQNQAAYQSASAQQDIQSRLDPMAYAQRQMRLKAATDRLGQLYAQDPSSFSFRSPSAYQMPSSSDVPSLGFLRNQSQDLASNVYTAGIVGGQPQLNLPPKAQDLQNPIGGQTYLS